MEATSDINQLTALVNINLDRIDCQKDLLEYYRWCRKNIRRALQEEIKTNLELNLRKKLDKLKFAQEIARRQLEKLSGELMLIPSHLIEKVKELTNSDETPQPLPEEEPLEDQVRLSLVKEIVDLEESIIQIEDEEKGLLRENFQEIEGQIPEEAQQLYSLWKRQTELVQPIFEILEKYDQTYIFAENISSSLMFDEKEIIEFIESLYEFGLIFHDMAAKPASVRSYISWLETLEYHWSTRESVGILLRDALLGERWDIITALLEGRTEPVKPNRYWEDYFEEQIEKNKVKIDRTLIQNVAFIGEEYRDGLYMNEEEYNRLGLLCDLAELIKGYAEVIKFLNRIDLYLPFLKGGREYQAVYNHLNTWKTISELKNWIDKGKEKLGFSHFEALLDALYSCSLERLEWWVKRRYFEFIQEQYKRNHETSNRYQTYNFNFNQSSLKEHYQTLGLTINATIDEVKKQHRKLAKEFHPDIGGNEEHMKKINQAYEAIMLYLTPRTSIML